MKLEEYDTVRIVSLGDRRRSFDGTDGVKRPPAVGDIGTVVHESPGGSLIVERVDAAGYTVWLAGFTRGE